MLDFFKGKPAWRNTTAAMQYVRKNLQQAAEKTPSGRLNGQLLA
jgi:hypothetical protein